MDKIKFIDNIIRCQFDDQAAYNRKDIIDKVINEYGYLFDQYEAEELFDVIVGAVNEIITNA